MRNLPWHPLFALALVRIARHLEVRGVVKLWGVGEEVIGRETLVLAAGGEAADLREDRSIPVDASNNRCHTYYSSSRFVMLFEGLHSCPVYEKQNARICASKYAHHMLP